MNKRLSLIVFIFSLFFTQCNNIKSTEKTIVAWVSLTDSYNMEGSLITIQDGDRFDGIFLSSKDGFKWYPGSENNNRTNIDMGISIDSSEIYKEFQIGIVYTKKSIKMFKNGKFVSEYPAENIDLLSSNTNIINFGLDYFYNNAFISQAIDDVRIYDIALSEAQLQSLLPNEPSDIEPYAWWTFDDGDLVDLSGPYTYYSKFGSTWNRLEFNNGKLFINQWGHIVASRDYSLETPKWPKNPPNEWPTFHLAHPGPGVAFPGDPNPAYFYKDKYHMHYIYKNSYGYSYAHVTSKDMVSWTWEPTVLTPPLTGHGMFSGTGFFTKEGTPAMIYHAVTKGNVIKYALDENLNKWSESDPVIAKDKNGNPVEGISYWDPDLWIMDNQYFAISGSELGDPPLMTSNDLKYWNYEGKLFHDDFPDDIGVSRFEDVSCPNMFQIGNKWMLLGISHTLGCRYYLGDFKDGKYLPDFHAKMNWVDAKFEKIYDNVQDGLVYFAPESILSKDGRRIMWAWLVSNKLSGVQSLPRELELPADGILRIKPLRELKKLRYGQISKFSFKIKGSEKYQPLDITGDAIDLEIKFNSPLPNQFGVDILGDSLGNNFVEILIDEVKNIIHVGNVKAPLNLMNNEDLHLRVFIDKNIIEIFANDKQAIVYEHEYIRNQPNIKIFSKDDDLFVESIQTWKMKNIYSNK